MKVVITGGMGFVGNEIAREISKAFEKISILAVGRTKNPPARKFLDGMKYIACDLSTKNNYYSWLEGADTVFHVAAKAGVGTNLKEYYDANYLATQYLLDACRSMGVKRFIYTSSPSVAFNEKSIQSGDESLPYTANSNNPYAYTKALAENIVLQAHQPQRFQTIALRPHLIWGKGDPHLLPRVIGRHRKGKLRIVGEGQNKVDLTHVRNVVHAHLCAFKAMVRNPSLGGNAYFINQNEPVRLWNWLNQLFKDIGLPVLNKKISLGSALFIGYALEKLWKNFRLSGEPPMTRFVAQQLAHDHWFSCKSAERDFDYKPLINMEQAMKESLPWLRNLNPS